jgi:arylsulfatase
VTRNIVLVTQDSLRADHCSFMGYDRETTPALDELARHGLVFENAMAAGVPTIASMTSVMTGQFSLASPEIGFNTEQREQVTSRRTLAETLSEAGYATGACSPNPPASSYFGFDEGFDWFEDYLHQDRGVTDRLWRRVLDRSIRGGGAATYLRLLRNLVQREEVLRPWDDYYQDIMAWRDGAEEPYFLWVLLLEPHHPWIPPTESQQWSSRADVYRSFAHYWEMLSSGWEPEFSEREHQRLVDLYDDSIRHGDKFLERLRQDLREDDPVFIVHADHGEEFGEHGRYGHQPYLYESLVHVPLVIANAGRQGIVERPVSLRSLAPTIAELADVEDVPARFPGRSLLDQDADAPDLPWAISKVFAGGERRIAVRSRNGKYISDPQATELYDLRLDPDEQVNIHDRQPEATAAFEDVVAAHVETERERRAIGDAVASLPESV